MIKDDSEERPNDLDAEIRKSKARLGELSEILGHIASFRNKHCDQLFQGLAQAFTAINPQVQFRPSFKQNRDTSDGYKLAATPRASSIMKDHRHTSSNRAGAILGYPQHILDMKVPMPSERKKKTFLKKK